MIFSKSLSFHLNRFKITIRFNNLLELISLLPLQIMHNLEFNNKVNNGRALKGGRYHDSRHTEPTLSSMLHAMVGASDENSVGTTSTLMLTDAQVNVIAGLMFPILVHPTRNKSAFIR